MRHYSSNKDLARFIRTLVAQGWAFRHGGRHNRLESPLGFFVVTPISPGDHRALMNLKRDIARLSRAVGA